MEPDPLFCLAMENLIACNRVRITLRQRARGMRRRDPNYPRHASLVLVPHAACSGNGGGGGGGAGVGGNSDK